MHSLITKLSLLFFASVISGCGTGLIGTEKPVEEKSAVYTVKKLNEVSKDWQIINIPSESTNPDEANDVSDVAYQSSKTGSVISANSACNGQNQNRTDLKSFTQMLFLGMNNLEVLSQKEAIIAGKEALETRAKGAISNKQRLFKTYVLRNRNCVYDLMFIANPLAFPQDEPTFSQFVSSLEFH